MGRMNFLLIGLLSYKVLCKIIMNDLNPYKIEANWTASREIGGEAFAIYDIYTFYTSTDYVTLGLIPLS